MTHEISEDLRQKTLAALDNATAAIEQQAAVIKAQQKLVVDLLNAAKQDLADRLSWGGPTMGREAAEARIKVLEEVTAAMQNLYGKTP